MKKVILGLIFVGGLYGQRSDTVFSTPFVNSQTLGAQTVRNIGQSYHILTLIASGGGCVAWGAPGRVELQGSFDGTNYVRIGQPVNTLVTGVPAITWGYGSYPYVQVNYIAGDIVNCFLTVNYSGSLSGTKINAVYDSNVKNGFVSAVVTTTGAGDITVGSCNTYTKNVSVYGFYLNNTTAGTLTGNVLKVQDSTPVIIDRINLGSIATLGSVSMKAETVPILGANQGSAAVLSVPPVDVVLTSSAAGLTGWVLFRCE